jgi:triacylglycerol lipase
MNMKSMSAYGRAHILALVSGIVYLEPAAASEQAEELGFTAFEYYNNGGAQAYRFENDTDVVFACRGTEPGNWNDMIADARLFKVRSDTQGGVHKGFKVEVDDIWDPVYEDLQSLKDSEKSIWFTGHSLGGAMSTIIASRAWADDTLAEPIELHTFGSPRPGNRRFRDSIADEKHYRWRHNNDIVTKVPPAFLGYRHTGQEHYLNGKGDLVINGGFWYKFKDQIKGLFANRFDSIADHAIATYAKHIKDLM